MSRLHPHLCVLANGIRKVKYFLAIFGKTYEPPEIALITELPVSPPSLSSALSRRCGQYYTPPWFFHFFRLWIITKWSSSLEILNRLVRWFCLIPLPSPPRASFYQDHSSFMILQEIERHFAPGESMVRQAPTDVEELEKIIVEESRKRVAVIDPIIGSNSWKRGQERGEEGGSTYMTWPREYRGAWCRMDDQIMNWYLSTWHCSMYSEETPLFRWESKLKRRTQSPTDVRPNG